MLGAALQILPLIPGLLDSTFKIIQAVRDDPATPEAAKIELAELGARLDDIVVRVKALQWP